MNLQTWELGEEEIIRPTKENLYKIMNALILCKGKMDSSLSLERYNSQWKYPARYCAVYFKISLPRSMKEKFEELSGFTLQQSSEININ